LIPSFLGDVLAGSLTASVIPTLIEVREQQGETAAHQLYSVILVAAAALLAAVAILAALGSGIIVRLLGSGFSADKARLTQMLFLAMTPVIPLSAVSVTWRAVLNSKEKFAAAALVPVMTPLVSIALLLAAGRTLGAYALALGATIGTLSEVGFLAMALHIHRIRLWPARPRWSQPARQVLSQYVPMTMGSIMLSGSNLVDQTMAAMLVAGSVSALNFGTRVTGVILAIGPTAFSTAILPRLSKMTALADWPALRNSVKKYALLSLVLSIPATAICMYFSEPIVKIIFQRGAFGMSDTHLVARVQFWSLLLVPVSMLLALVVRLVSSLKYNELLLRMALLSLVVNIALDYLLMQRMGVAGIALATSLVALLSLIFLSYLLSRRVKTRALAAY
jgi:putative peptidoglycan lipid II flippase